MLRAGRCGRRGNSSPCFTAGQRPPATSSRSGGSSSATGQSPAGQPAPRSRVAIASGRPRRGGRDGARDALPLPAGAVTPPGAGGRGASSDQTLCLLSAPPPPSAEDRGSGRLGGWGASYPLSPPLPAFLGGSSRSGRKAAGCPLYVGVRRERGVCLPAPLTPLPGRLPALRIPACCLCCFFYSPRLLFPTPPLPVFRFCCLVMGACARRGPGSGAEPAGPGPGVGGWVGSPSRRLVLMLTVNLGWLFPV